MIKCSKKQIKGLIVSIITILFLLLGMCISANAQENIRVYNRDKEIILSHELFYYNEHYYLFLDDLQQLGLTVTKNNNTYTITSNDCLGEERTLIISPFTIGTGTVITPVNALLTSEESKIVDNTTCRITYKCRSTQIIGYTTDTILLPSEDTSIGGNQGIMIKVDGELYISAQYVGSKLSHRYLLKNGRMYFYIADDSAVIMETTVNLVEGAVAPSDGYQVKIYTAYKSGEGNTIDDFEVLSSSECTIDESKSNVTCMIETPAEKIINNNIYYIVDLGERYALACSEYDFSKVGKVLVYGQQKDVTYTVNVNLPETDEQDVPFTVYVEADNNTYSKQGVVKGGEKTVEFQFIGLPVARGYKTRIEFDYHKYENSILKEVHFLNIAYAKDFKIDFTAQYSRVVVCNVSLPDDFVPDGDVEIMVQLAKYISNGSMVILDHLTDWSDSRIITLNNEKRSEQICLYSQASSSELSYKLISGAKGLCEKGFLHVGGKTTSDSDSSKEITEDLFAEITLLQKKKIAVSVFRPLDLSVDNDIFATVVLDDTSTALINDVMIDFTQIPLISYGERESQFEFEIAEDKSYKLKIKDITGDERLFDYYCYVKPVDSPADEGKKCRIGFSDDDISITLLQCNNISGTVACEKMDLNFDVRAACDLYNGEIIFISADVENGKFSLKIPEDAVVYTIDIQTRVGKKSYYVSDCVSTNNEAEATEIFFKYNDDKDIVLKYILQNPVQPIKISIQSQYDYFMLENVSDYMIDEYEAYVAYYDKQGILISVDKSEEKYLISGRVFKLPVDTANYNIKKAKAFVWKKDILSPLGNVSEISVNQTYAPEQ